MGKPKNAGLLGIALAAICLSVAGGLWPRPAIAATISFVQVNAAVPQTPQTTVTVPYLAAQTAGNLNIVVVGWNDTTRTVQTVVDNKGNTYTLAIGPTTGTASG